MALEAINLIREHNPDLVFLDVQMPDWDGFWRNQKTARQESSYSQHCLRDCV